jgi:GT2 family glycosyltransferase
MTTRHDMSPCAEDAATRQDAEAQLRQQMANLKTFVIDSQQKNDALMAQLAQARMQIEAIHASASWRATAPLRRVTARLPLSWRRWLRRIFKALWWALTPHRMPARWRYWKRRRYGAGYTYTPPPRPQDIEKTITELARQPVFSIVVPLYNTPQDVFSKMLESVLGQWYPRWELILVDDKSPLPSVRQGMEKISDPRVKNIFPEKNEGISGATNHGLAAATGDYIVFLDHDDELTPDCLFELARCAAEQDPDYIYSDEDKILADGRFGDVFFKPDWSPDALMSTMYTCHVSCVRRSMLAEVGGLRPEFDGSQDWDFILRVTEKTRRIAHIAKVLYHWRAVPGSAAADHNAKPYAIEAGRRAQIAALERRNLAATVEELPNLPGHHRIHYAMRGQPLVSIIIPSKNNGPVLSRCIDTIRQNSSYRHFEIVLLDNGSSEAGTLDYLETLANAPDIKMVRHDAPFNYSGLNNLGARKAAGEILLFLNDDTEVLTPDWIERMAGYAQLDHVGSVGAKLLYPGGREIQHGGVLNLAHGPDHAFLRRDADDPGYFLRNIIEYDWAAVTGACMMIERRKFDAAGGFDENFPVAYNDVDLCFRLLDKGLYNVVCQAVRLIHHESLSRGNDSADQQKLQRLALERISLYIKHPRFLHRDPFHNANLDPGSLYFALR